MLTNSISVDSAAVLQSVARDELCQIEGGLAPAIAVGFALGALYATSVAIIADETKKKGDVKILERAQDMVRIGSR